jgi:hypothetical protein
MTSKPIKTEKIVKPIFTSLWKNGAKIEVFYHKEPIEGEFIDDRIQVIVSPSDSKPRGWIMTAEEAVDLIYGLAKATSFSLEDRYENKL